jgi:hypothetical protein
MSWHLRLQLAPLPAVGLLTIVGINGALLAKVTMQVISDDPVVADSVNWNAHLPGSIANAAGRKPIDAYRQILAHPLFFKSREPFVPAPPAPPPAPAQPPAVVVDPGLVVGGVMMTSALSKAYLFSRAGPSGTWISEGEMFQGWRVKAIDKSGVRLEQGGRSIDLQLYPRD